MSKNDPTGKQHQLITKTTSQPAPALSTPSVLLSGLSGINRAANKSDSTNFGKEGKGRSKRVPAERPGTDGTVSLYPNSSDSTSVGC